MVVGAIAISDTIRPSAAAAVSDLRALGLECVLLTGDNEATARAVAESVGITDVVAGALPAEKVEVIRGFQAQGRSVAMVSKVPSTRVRSEFSTCTVCPPLSASGTVNQ